MSSPEQVAQLEHRFIPGPAGELAIRIYSPRLSGPAPVILYVHGGGWVTGDLDACDRQARALTNTAQAVVVSTEYRKAPEHPMPAAWDDTYAAYRWVLEHAVHFGGDPARVVVAGEGAGATLAFDIPRRAREDGLTEPCHQVLISPVAGTARSRDELARAPATTVITAEVDPLRTEGDELAEALAAAGVDVRHRCFDGVAHGFIALTPLVASATDAIVFAAEGIRRSLVKVGLDDTSRQPVVVP